MKLDPYRAPLKSNKNAPAIKFSVHDISLELPSSDDAQNNLKVFHREQHLLNNIYMLQAEFLNLISVYGHYLS